MVNDIKGLVGLRPSKESVSKVTSPPYDVIKPDTKIEKLLKENEESLFHVILGKKPKESLEYLVSSGNLIKDDEPGFYVYKQEFLGKVRYGVYAAVEVSDYKESKIIRHEKTFDKKVKGRMALRNETNYSFGPVFLLTKANLNDVLIKTSQNEEPLFSFTSDFNGETDLDNIKNTVYKVLQESDLGKEIQNALSEKALYIADGHHRYHTSLLNNQTHFLAYICEKAEISAYNRVINGEKDFNEIKDKFNLKKVDKFETPEKNSFCIYTKGGIYKYTAKNVPNDVVGKLDCSILEKEIYPSLGLKHEMIMDLKYFDYYPEQDLDKMMEKVDKGDYDLAIALHPVSIDELMSVADAGLDNSDIVMPEKSTFFTPKILSGLIIYKHETK